MSRISTNNHVHRKTDGSFIVPAIAVAMCLFLLPRHADAAFTITVAEVGSDVVLSGSGTINLTDLNSDGEYTTGILPGIDPLGGFNPGFVLGNKEASIVSIDLYGLGQISAPVAYGTMNVTGVGLGDYFGISTFTSAPVGIGVPVGYISESLLQGSVTFSNKNFTDLGLTLGTYTWEWGSGGNADSVTMNIIPEPSSALLVCLGTASLVLFRRRHRI